MATVRPATAAAQATPQLLLRPLIGLQKSLLLLEPLTSTARAPAKSPFVGLTPRITMLVELPSTFHPLSPKIDSGDSTCTKATVLNQSTHVLAQHQHTAAQ
jgi:hypothetical protein